MASEPGRLKPSPVLPTPPSLPCAPGGQRSNMYDGFYLFVFMITTSISSNSRFVPFSISVTAHRMMSPHSQSCSLRSQAACQWHPGSTGWGGLRRLWWGWAAARSTSLKDGENVGKHWEAMFLYSNRALLRCLTLPGVVLQKQFLACPLDVPQHIETVSKARGEGHVVGQWHGELEVCEWQRGHKPKAEIILSDKRTQK